jgi:hypothetical protein
MDDILSGFWSRLSSPFTGGIGNALFEPYRMTPTGPNYMPTGGTTEEGGAPRWTPMTDEQRAQMFPQPVTPTGQMGVQASPEMGRSPVNALAPAPSEPLAPVNMRVSEPLAPVNMRVSEPAPFTTPKAPTSMDLMSASLRRPVNALVPPTAPAPAPFITPQAPTSLDRMSASLRRPVNALVPPTAPAPPLSQAPGRAAADVPGSMPSRTSFNAPVTAAVASYQAPVQAKAGPVTEIPKERIAYLNERRKGTNVNIAGLNPVFADRLVNAIRDAEAATGERAVFTSAHRTREEQAAAYNRFLQGKTALAAPPGRSRHERGDAVDLRPGKVLDWLHQNAHKYGLEFLSGNAFARDPIHLQLRYE